MDVNVPSILLMRVLDDSRVVYNVTSTELSFLFTSFLQPDETL